MIENRKKFKNIILHIVKGMTKMGKKVTFYAPCMELVCRVWSIEGAKKVHTRWPIVMVYIKYKRYVKWR